MATIGITLLGLIYQNQHHITNSSLSSLIPLLLIILTINYGGVSGDENPIANAIATILFSNFKNKK